MKQLERRQTNKTHDKNFSRNRKITFRSLSVLFFLCLRDFCSLARVKSKERFAPIVFLLAEIVSSQKL